MVFNIPIIFEDDRFNNNEMAANFRNSRWRWPPFWKVHFRFSHQFEKEIPGLLLPIQNPCVGLSIRLRVVYSRGLLCWSDFRCKSAKSKNRSKFWCFWGRIPLRNKFEGSKPPKGTCTCRNTSFELSCVRIGQELRPVGEMRKRKKRENKSHKTVIFHHSVAALPVNRSRPNLVCL